MHNITASSIKGQEYYSLIMLWWGTKDADLVKWKLKLNKPTNYKHLKCINKKEEFSLRVKGIIRNNKKKRREGTREKRKEKECKSFIWSIKKYLPK